MAGTATMAGIGTIGTTVIGTTVIGATGKLGQIRATALNEQVRAASFAKALLLIRPRVGNDGLHEGGNPTECLCDGELPKRRR